MGGKGGAKERGRVGGSKLENKGGESKGVSISADSKRGVGVSQRITARRGIEREGVIDSICADSERGGERERRRRRDRKRESGLE